MGINDAGTIVAQASIGSTLVWMGGVVYDLSVSIKPGDPLKGQVDLFGGGTTSINDRGTIAADGQYKSGSKLGQIDVFLLAPFEEVTSWR